MCLELQRRLWKFCHRNANIDYISGTFTTLPKIRFWPGVVDSKRCQPIMDRDLVPYDHSPSKCNCYKERDFICGSWRLNCESVEGDKGSGQVEVIISLLL